MGGNNWPQNHEMITPITLGFRIGYDIEIFLSIYY